jgi:hypothetical protein
MLDNHGRWLTDSSGNKISPSEEGTVESIRDNVILASPTHKDALAVPDTEVSYTITAGKKHLLIQNTGSKIVYWGGTGLTDAKGYKLTPMGSYLFTNVASGFKVYFICSTGENSTVRGVEF